MSVATPGAGQFWPQGYNLNTLGRGLLGDATYQISRVSGKRIFSCFPNIGLCKNCELRGGPFLSLGI